MFKLDQMEQDTYECKMIEACKKNKDTICNPIYKFTEQDIWEYARARNIKMNPLYERGYKRIGCIGCPLGGPKSQKREFEDYPKYKENYKKAFERMNKVNIERRAKNGQQATEYDRWTGEQWIRWWIGEDPYQIKIDDLIPRDNGGDDT